MCKCTCAFHVESCVQPHEHACVNPPVSKCDEAHLATGVISHVQFMCSHVLSHMCIHIWTHISTRVTTCAILLVQFRSNHVLRHMFIHMWTHRSPHVMKHTCNKHVQIMCNRVHNHMCIRMWIHMSAHVTACAIAQIQCKRNHVGALFRRGAGAWPPPPPGPLTLSTANHIRKTRDHTCTRMCLHVLSYLWTTCAHAWLSSVWAHVKHAFTWHIHTRTDTGMKCNHTLTPF
jgi:hypothetical protein